MRRICTPPAWAYSHPGGARHISAPITVHDGWCMENPQLSHGLPVLSRFSPAPTGPCHRARARRYLDVSWPSPGRLLANSWPSPGREKGFPYTNAPVVQLDGRRTQLVADRAGCSSSRYTLLRAMPSCLAMAAGPMVSARSLTSSALMLTGRPLYLPAAFAAAMPSAAAPA